MFTKILKENPKYSTPICIALCNGFISKDESIQKKIAKLILSYANAENIKEHIVNYTDNILMSVKPLLKNLFDESDASITEKVEIPQTMENKYLPIIKEDNKIVYLDTFDDFLYFVGQIFDNNEAYHCFMLPIYLQKFNETITSDQISKLEPIFKKATTILNDWNPNVGLLDRTFISFFISYGKYLIQRYPDACQNIKTILEAKSYTDLADWRSKSFHMELYPFYFVLLKTMDSIKGNVYFEHLSTPTHLPLWIDPIILVKRLKTYQDKGITPYSFDLQMALQRCALDNTTEALALAKAQLHAEMRDLMIFFLDKNTTAEEGTKYPALWMTAAVTKNPQAIPPEKEKWGFGDIQEEFLTGKFTWKLSKRNNLTVFDIRLPAFAIKGITDTKWLPKYTFARFHSKRMRPGDIQRLIYSFPYNHDNIIAEILYTIEDYSSLDSEIKGSMLNALQCLYELQLPYSHMDYLFVSLCLLAPDKAIRDYAAELWIQSVSNKLIDNREIGQSLGKIIKLSWLPLKRFNDMIADNLINISGQHNIGLEETINRILLEMEDPITNLKKFLEIYKELIALNNSKPANDIKEKLAIWTDNGTLKKITKQLLEM